MKPLFLALCFAMFLSSPVLSQGPNSGRTPSQGNTASQGNTSPPNGQKVVGTYNITTDGMSGTYNLSANSTRSAQQHAEWHLTYSHTNGAWCLHTEITAYTAKITDTVTGLSGPTPTQTTILTQNLVKGRPAPNQSGPCQQTASQTYPADTTGTLEIDNVPLMENSPLTVHKLYPALVMSTGSSLPSIVVYQQTTVNGVAQADSNPYKIITAFLTIKRWDKATWTTPYSGKIAAQNDYSDYITPQGVQWLKVTADWNTTPAP